MIAALRTRHADRCDPVRFRFIEALARRVQGLQGEARRRLEERLASALHELDQRVAHAQGDAGDALASALARHPAAADELRQRFAAGDFGGLRRRIAALDGRGSPSPLAELTARLAPHSPEHAGRAGSEGSAGCAVAAGAAGELKAVRYFRDTWSQLSVEQQLAQALAQAPENAGPLNSHLLVLRALQRMREVSPDYLNRFMPYIDALLWLEQADGIGMPAEKGVAPADGDRKKSRTAAPPGKTAKPGR
ncbi:MAG: DUF2894 domain-containing protein [Rhodocyclales bacterium]|nr:DUF2894 domain-containing protein [Rhodocyclales bacterium]